jgi:misacylated tRNA(Ala) deacylase
MTDALYLHDAYARTFDATVIAVGPEGLRLDRTLFYPTGGGQPDDRGVLHTAAGTCLDVTSVAKVEGEIVHRVAPGATLPAVGDRVRGELDWARRFWHMRGHTAVHILSGAVYHDLHAGITGGQIGEGSARMDFAMAEFSRPLAEQLVARVAEVVAQDLPVEVRFVPRAQVGQDPGLVRVASELLPDVDPVRLVDIRGFDVQADGGTHVRSTGEVGSVTLDRLENKGAKNKRLYLRIGEAPSSPGPSG